MGGAVVVIGAGHNGLVCAATLARAGRQVVVVEARGVPGGLAATEEFHPGYHTAGVLHDTGRVSPAVLRGLGVDLPWRSPPPIASPAEDGPGIVLDTDVPDPDGVASLRRVIERYRAFAAAILEAPAPELGDDAKLLPLAKAALGLRRMGAPEMLELLRVGPLCADDWIAEHVADDHTRAALLQPALTGTWTGPRSPFGAASALIRGVLAGDELAGGSPALVAALVEALTGRGGTIRCDARVTEIRLDRGSVAGVRLADGTDIDADVVISAIGPRPTLLDLVDPLYVPPILEREIRNVRCRGIEAKIHLALSGPLDLAGRPGEAFEHLRIAEHPLDHERAFDAAKNRRLPDRPTLDIRVPSVSQPGLAPDGHHVVSILAHGVPYALDAGWSAETRAVLLERVISTLERYVPDLRDRIVGHEVLDPATLATRYGLDGGHLEHGELALDQVWALRPSPQLSRHATPIRGLYLASSGTHPGGGVTGRPGALAAAAVLR